MKLMSWRERPQEDAHLFNPAFCGALIYEFTKSYLDDPRHHQLNLAIVFCVMPIVLHKKTRDTLHSRTVTSLYTWLQRNPEVRVGYATRAENLAPYLKEAVAFCVARETLAFNDSGHLVLGVQKANFTPKKLETLTAEVRDIVACTKLAGRWFSGAGEASNILASWGITV